MIWMKRDFAYADYAPAMDELEKLLTASGPLYAEFIMVSTATNDPGVSTYYIGVPNEGFAMPFHGFERVPESALPKVIDALHIADATKEPFRSRFKFAHNAA